MDLIFRSTIEKSVVNKGMSVPKIIGNITGSLVPFNLSG